MLPFILILISLAAAKRFVIEINGDQREEIIENLQHSGYEVEHTAFDDVLVVTDSKNRRNRRDVSASFDLASLFGVQQVNEDEILKRSKRRIRGTIPNYSTGDLHEDMNSNKSDFSTPLTSEVPVDEPDEPFDFSNIHELINCPNSTKACNYTDLFEVIKCLMDLTCDPPPTRSTTTESQVNYTLPDISNTTYDAGYYNDPLYSSQWTIHRHNVHEAWLRGYTGQGVVVVVADDGLEWKHEDLRDNYRADVSIDLNGQDMDPSPETYDAEFGDRCCKFCDEECPDHGTKCAGVIAAKANNNKCIVGVAHGADIGGIRMLDGKIYDKTESDSLSYLHDTIDIYTLSWGPDDDGKMLDAPRLQGKRAIENGIKHGRYGKGNIYVWGSGNGWMVGDNCGADGYANSMYTVLFAAANFEGKRAYYSEGCSAVMSTIFSGNGRSSRQPQVCTTKTNNTCASDFGGTSAVNPFAAGVIALGLEANGNLNWRDVQHMVVLSSRKRLPSYQGYNQPLTLDERDADWQRNGAGKLTSASFGFGLFDAAKFVELAERWPPSIPDQQNCSLEWNPRLKEWTSEKSKRIEYGDEVRDNFQESESRKSYSGLNTTLQVRNDCNINYLEHVVVTAKVKHPVRGELQLILTSPSNTKSMLLDFRFRDKNNGGLGIQSPHSNGWSMNTVQNWGERPHGNWVLTINDKSLGTHNARSGTRALIYWRLDLFGTAGSPPNL